MGTIKVLIVDDHSLVRTGVISLLRDVSEIEIAGEAENGNEAIAKCLELKPDVVLMDISMPGLGGMDATEIIKKNWPSINVLMLTMYENEEYIFSSIRKGALGVLHKNVSKAELIKALKTVAEGKRYFGASLSQMMIESLLKKFQEDDTDKAKDKVIVTKREKEILHYVASGLSNQEIAEILEISSRTVDTHKTNLMQKLNLKSTAALARYAFENHY